MNPFYTIRCRGKSYDSFGIRLSDEKYLLYGAKEGGVIDLGWFDEWRPAREAARALAGTRHGVWHDKVPFLREGETL